MAVPPVPPPVAQVPPPPAGMALPHPPAPLRPWVPWTAGTAVLATLGILAVDHVLGSAAFIPAELSGQLYFAVGSFLVLAVGCLLATRHGGRFDWRALVGRRPRWSDVGIGLVGGAVIVFLDGLVSGAAFLLWPATGGNAQEWIEASTEAAPALTTIGVVLTGPIAEELLFRGLLFQGLRLRFGIVWAMAGSAAAFAVVHPGDLSPSSLLLLVSVLVAGLVLAGLLQLRGTLVAPIVAHIAANGAAVAFGMFGGGLAWGVAVGPDQPVAAFTLEVGQCAMGYPDEVQPPSGGTPAARWTRATAVDCDDVHDIEVYAAETVGEDDELYPGEVEVSFRADAVCFEAFEPFVGRDYYESHLDYLALQPAASAWERGDRETRCVVYEMSRRERTGSARGSGR